MPDKKQWQDQEVSVALELLISTLADERKRIYDVGANAMKAQDGDTALAVINFAKKLEGFQEKVKTLSNDWSALIDEKISAPEKVQEIVDGDGKLFGLRTRKASSGHSRTVNSPVAPKSSFSISFPDGTVIQLPKACDVFVAAIEHIGVHNVLPLNLVSNGEMLISTQISEKYPQSSKLTASGYYVSTQSSTAQKIKYLQTIQKLLNIEFSINPEKTLVINEEKSCTPVDSEKEKFVAFLKTELSATAVSSYAAALRELEKWSKAQSVIAAENNLLAFSYTDLVKLQNTLNNNSAFQDWTSEKHHRFSAVLKKLIKYRTH